MIIRGGVQADDGLRPLVQRMARRALLKEHAQTEVPVAGVPRQDDEPLTMTVGDYIDQWVDRPHDHTQVITGRGTATCCTHKNLITKRISSFNVR